MIFLINYKGGGKMITTITLNASVDKAYYMGKKIENGKVMRVKSVRNTAGGKGLNVARIVNLCGENVLATGLVGGYNGAYLESLLDEDGIHHDFDHIKGETRSCINILDDEYGSTEYLEPGCDVTEEEEQSFLNRFPTIIEQSSMVTISGSIPKGMSKDIYKTMILMAKNAGKQVILDTSGELLEKGIEASPTVVKPNKDEMEMLFHTKIENIDDVISNAKKIMNHGIPYVVISLGGDGALMLCEKGVFVGKPPKMEAVNTVGCGDSMVGALAVAFYRNYGPEKALQFAVAIASANALSPNTGNFDTETYQNLIQNIEVVEYK